MELDSMIKAREAIREITYHDLDIDKLWLSHLYHAQGYLHDAITQFKEDPNETKQHKFRMFEDGINNKSSISK